MAQGRGDIGNGSARGVGDVVRKRKCRRVSGTRTDNVRAEDRGHAHAVKPQHR